MDFRHEFKRDVVIDMYGYRRLGHNEATSPRSRSRFFTEPSPKENPFAKVTSIIC